MSETINPAQQFERHGMSASYHYADDTCGEWARGDVERENALHVFDAHPAHQAEMRELAKKFLWSCEFARLRPENKE